MKLINKLIGEIGIPPDMVSHRVVVFNYAIFINRVSASGGKVGVRGKYFCNRIIAFLNNLPGCFIVFYEFFRAMLKAS